MKRILLLASALLLLLPACRDDRAAKPLTDAERETIRKKADGRLLRMIETGEPERAAVIAVFEGDAFLEHGQELEENGVTILNESGNTGILLATGPQARWIASSPLVRRITYLSVHGRLGRIDTLLEMDILRWASEDRQTEPVPLLLRFGALPGDEERRFLESSGFRIVAQAGPVWSVSGPPSAIPRLLENERIIFIQGASEARHM